MAEEVVRCIKVDIDGEPSRSWCGRLLPRHEWTFQNIDHAALLRRAGGRQLPCPACVKAVTEALSAQHAS